MRLVQAVGATALSTEVRVSPFLLYKEAPHVQYFTTEQLIEDLTQLGIMQKEKVIL